MVAQKGVIAYVANFTAWEFLPYFEIYQSLLVFQELWHLPDNAEYHVLPAAFMTTSVM